MRKVRQTPTKITRLVAAIENRNPIETRVARVPPSARQTARPEAAAAAKATRVAAMKTIDEWPRANQKPTVSGRGGATP